MISNGSYCLDSAGPQPGLSEFYPCLELKDRLVLLKYLKREDGAAFVCTLCGKSFSQRGNALNHVESVHFPTLFEYRCSHCGIKKNNYNSLNVHISTAHRDRTKKQIIGIGNDENI